MRKRDLVLGDVLWYKYRYHPGQWVRLTALTGGEYRTRSKWGNGVPRQDGFVAVVVQPDGDGGGTDGETIGIDPTHTRYLMTYADRQQRLADEAAARTQQAKRDALRAALVRERNALGTPLTLADGALNTSVSFDYHHPETGTLTLSGPSTTLLRLLSLLAYSEEGRALCRRAAAEPTPPTETAP